MDRIEEIRTRAEKASRGPWSACHDGECRCKQVWCANDHPVAIVSCGKTGDDYPEIKDGKAVMKQETYWDIAEETGVDNASFMAHAREDIPYLLTALAEKDKRIEELEKRYEHCFERRGDSGKNNDDRFCKHCGEYITSNLHTRHKEPSSPLPIPHDNPRG